MIPGKYNFICPQGSTFSQQLTWTIEDVPVNLETYTARMQVREKHSSKFPVIDINTENNGIVLGGEEGTIDLYIDFDVTSAIVPKTYVYDLEIVSSSEVVRLMEGSFIVTPEVTR
jgi:hypothetical protein